MAAPSLDCRSARVLIGCLQPLQLSRVYGPLRQALPAALDAADDAHALVLEAAQLLLPDCVHDRQRSAVVALLLDCSAALEQKPMAQHHALAAALAAARPRFFRKLGVTYDVGGAVGALAAARALLGHGDAVEAALLVSGRTGRE
jgi:hypothetical protein